MNLAAILLENSRIHRLRPAVRDVEGTFTWGDFAERVRRAAGMLLELGVGPGERYGLVMRNSFRQSELIWTGHWMGAVPVPVNWRLAPAEIAAVAMDAGCRVLALDPDFLGMLDAPELSQWRQHALVVGASPAVAPGGRPHGLPEYDRLLDAAKPAPMRDSGENDEAIVLYTGGTTGRSKGVRLSHRNLIANSMQVGLALRIRPDDVTLNVAPMFHAAGLCSNITTFLGGCHVFLRQFTPRDMLAAIERYRVNYTTVVPAMLKMIIDDPEAGRYDVSSLRVMFYGSSPMPVPWMKGTVQLFAHSELYQAYGLTETAPILTVLSDTDYKECLASGNLAPLASAGRPLVGVQICIQDDGGHELPQGEEGEIVVRAPGVMLGYHNRPGETASVLHEGWFRTGDIGRLDEEGRLYILDRKKDMIISGGENVYSVEVEAAIARHPAVGEVAVVGVPDDTLGEALLAVIVLREGMRLTADELIVHCRGLIGGYKIPRRIVFAEALPRSTVGKVLKGALRQSHAPKP